MDKKNFDVTIDYTIAQASVILNITNQTVFKYLKEGTLKGTQKGPKKKWYIKGTEIKRLLKKWKAID